MATIANAEATLRIMGDNLMPEEVTKVLGSTPTEVQFKGQVLAGQNTGKSRVAKFGMWRLRAAGTTPGDLDAHVREIIDQLTDDFAAWDNLASRFEIDLYCGWFMEKENEGIGIAADTLRELAARSIHLRWTSMPVIGMRLPRKRAKFPNAVVHDWQHRVDERPLARAQTW